MAKPIILMVENDIPTINLYHEVFSQEYNVLACSNEVSVLELLSTEDVHTVILEPAINGGMGWGILSSVISTLRESPTPVIICSTLDERKRGLEMGVDAFLVKPVLPSVLLDTIHRLEQFKHTD